MSNKLQNKKYHFIYKTTNLLNGKFYYGMHSTSNLKDGYLGSGKRLGYSIKKHGKENFKCEILEFLPDRIALKTKENELITEEMLQHSLCMNLKPGGQGGFCNKEHMMKCSNAGNDSIKNKLSTDENYRKEYGKMRSANNVKMHAEGKLKPWSETFSWKGKSQSEIHKQHISNSMKGKQSGELNSQFSTKWINNGIEFKKIKIELLEYHLLLGWNLGKKIKNT